MLDAVKQQQYVVLPRHRPMNRPPQIVRKRKLESSMKSGSNSHTMKVVIPHSNTKNQHIKKEYLASTIKPENTFALMCESTLNEIYEQSSNIKSVDV